MPTYEIQYRESDHVSLTYGKTPSAAKYSKFLDLDGAFSTFKDFLAAVKSVRKVGPRANAYDHIKRQYGMTFQVGDMCSVTGEGPEIEGKQVEVVHPCSSGSYVNALMEGNVYLFHPMSLSLVDHNQ